MKVGIFDSGVGGLTVLKKLKEKYPLNDYIYYGDTLNIPYGEKDKDTLYKLSCRIVDFLIRSKVDLIVIACGTVSSNCYLELKKKYNIEIIDIINPTIDYIKRNNFSSIGVMATTRTVDSHIFKNKLKIPVEEVACPEFVEIIETNNFNKINVTKYLRNIKSNTIILGCTHYPIIKDKIKRNCIDMADNIILNKNDGNATVNLYFSKLDDNILKNIYLLTDNMKLCIYNRNI